MLNFAGELGGGFVARTQQFIVNFSIWWSMPAVLIVLASWYLKAHDTGLGIVLGLTPLIGTALVIAFWTNYKQTGLPPAKITFEQDKEFQKLETMYRVNLRDARLQGADLTGAILPKADLRDAYLTNARLISAYLEEADLRGANLRNADLTSADLDHVKLDTNTVLQGAVLQEASIAGIDLQGARLDGLNL
jgi:uncharacterized protein YjbI with pentapeptide repeats